MDTAMNMGFGATAGFLFRQYAEASKQKHSQMMAALKASEESKEAAAKRGGTWIRRALVLLIGISFTAAVLAVFWNKDVILEYALQRKLFFFEWEKIKHIPVHGVVILKENRSAFELITGFYFGQGVK